jgi:hypothetical protein
LPGHFPTVDETDGEYAGVEQPSEGGRRVRPFPPSNDPEPSGMSGGDARGRDGAGVAHPCADLEADPMCAGHFMRAGFGG